MKIINLTPHDIISPNSVILSTGIARVTENTEKVGNIDGIDIVHRTFGRTIGLPEYEEGTYYVVSFIVAQANPGRKDLLVPGEQTRDERGRITGCKNLVIPNKGEE